MYGQNEVPVELLRFVTAYRAEMDMFVDITPFSNYLTSNSTTFYGIIDVGGASKNPVTYQIDVSSDGKCSLEKFDGAGNGWALGVELYFWDDETNGAVPSQTVMIAPGYTGSPEHKIYFGKIEAHEGTVEQGQIKFDKKVDLAGHDQADGPPVYDCEGKSPSDIQQAAFLGLIERPEFMPGSMGGGSNRTDSFALRSEIEFDYSRQIIKTTIESVESRIVTLKLPANVPVPQSLIDYLSDGAEAGGRWPVFYDNELRSKFRFGSKKAGEVTKILPTTQGQPAQIKVELTADDHCITPVWPTKKDGLLVIPAYSKTPWKDAESQIASHVKSTTMKGSEDACTDQLLFHKDGSEWQIKGRVLLNGKTESDQAVGAAMENGKKVCVLQQACQGNILSQKFDVSLKPGQVALLHLVTTAHGWFHTTKQCGEFCKTKYSIKLNGKALEAASVTPWRECGSNPISEQYGTWSIPRNGWCPGSVQTGIFIDVTGSLVKNENQVDLEMLVMSKDGRYERFTDYAGFALQDDMRSFMFATLNLFVYDEQTVARVRQQPIGYTAAEVALRTGTSDGPNEPTEIKALAQPPPSRNSQTREFMKPWTGDATIVGKTIVREVYHEEHHEVRTIEVHHTTAGSALLQGAQNGRSVNTNFEAGRARMWHLYNDTTIKGALPVPLIVYDVKTNVLQMEKDFLRKPQELSPDNKVWTRVALRLRLKAPTDGMIGHWDMIGAVGVVLNKDAYPKGVSVARPSKEKTLKDVWPVQWQPEK